MPSSGWWLMPNQYEAKVVRVRDDDSVDLMINLGFGSYRLSRLEVFGFNREKGFNGVNHISEAMKILRNHKDVYVVVHEALTLGLYPVDLCFFDEPTDAEIVLTAWLVGQGRTE